ncbi:MAG TPA: VOC family protein [Chitinophagaceae bacterium]|nr:VOC family protein [Chitinophagaceae bacterium]
MRIEHIAIWVSDLDIMRSFYEKYFNARSNQRYHNVRTGFMSYFLSFENSARLEIMTRPDVLLERSKVNILGYTHFAFSVGSKEKVLALTELLRKDGYTIVGEPRTTGDGYFESVIKDPDGNLVEITI